MSMLVENPRGEAKRMSTLRQSYAKRWDTREWQLGALHGRVNEGLR